MKAPGKVLKRVMNHRLIQVGKCPKGYLVQLATQSRISPEVSSGCSGFDPVRSWKPPRLHSLFGQPVPLLDCHQSKREFFCFQWDLPHSSLCLSLFWQGLLWPCLHAKFTISTGGSTGSLESPFLLPDEQASASPYRMPALLLQAQPPWQSSTDPAALTMPSLPLMRPQTKHRLLGRVDMLKLKSTDLSFATVYVLQPQTLLPCPAARARPFLDPPLSSLQSCSTILYHCVGLMYPRGTAWQLSLFCYLGLLSAHPCRLPGAPGSAHGFGHIGCVHQVGVPWRFGENELWPLLQITVKRVRQERSWKKSKLASRQSVCH